MGKKGGKKAKKGKKKESEELKEEMSEVDKEYFQIIINDLQDQVAKLTERCKQLEAHNEQLQGDFRRLDEESADVIAFLRRQLTDKGSEIGELQERLTGLKQAREAEGAAYEKRIADLQHKAQVNEEQLSAEIKLLNGKLNSLEEFRLQKNDLNAKFAQQEVEMKQKDTEHENSLREVERKFIISKNRLKKDMEEQLMSLSAKFQEATATRMAATTQRAVHENIALTAEVARLRTDVLFQRSLNQTQEEKITSLSREVKVLKELLEINAEIKKQSRAKKREKRDSGMQTECADVGGGQLETASLELRHLKRQYQESETGDAALAVRWEDQSVAVAATQAEEATVLILSDGASDGRADSQASDTQRPSYKRGSLGFVSK